VKNEKLISKLNLTTLITLIPLILFGFYKHGIYLYKKEYIDLFGALKPLIIITLSVVGALLADVIKEFKTNRQIDFSILSKSRTSIIESIILAMVLPIKSSPVIVFIIVTLVNLFLDKIKINKIALMYLLLALINSLLGLNTFQNTYELTNSLNYDGFDLFLGFGSGGICATSILLITASIIILSFNKLYKRDLVVSSIIVFILLGTIPYMISEEYSEILKFIFGYNILFSFVYIAPNLLYSTYTLKGQILSGIVLAFLTYFLTFVTPYNAVFISIIIVSLLSGIFDRIFVIK